MHTFQSLPIQSFIHSQPGRLHAHFSFFHLNLFH
jgi:hypothetical protein